MTILLQVTSKHAIAHIVDSLVCTLMNEESLLNMKTVPNWRKFYQQRKARGHMTEYPKSERGN